MMYKLNIDEYTIQYLKLYMNEGKLLAHLILKGDSFTDTVKEGIREVL